jgi:hypothetical protein
VGNFEHDWIIFVADNFFARALREKQHVSFVFVAEDEAGEKLNVVSLHSIALVDGRAWST